MQRREAILSRIRKSLNVGDNDAIRQSKIEERLFSAPIGIIPQRGQIEQEAKCRLFTEKVKNVQTTVDNVSNYDEIPAVVATYLRDNNLPSIVQMGESEKLASIPWHNSPHIQIEKTINTNAEAVSITHAHSGIAETGTVVLNSGKENPTGNNFLPQAHIVVIDSNTIEGDFESTWSMLRKKFGKGVLPRTVNMITGPSRSADIQQTLLLGAHGPRAMHIIIVN